MLLVHLFRGNFLLLWVLVYRHSFVDELLISINNCMLDSGHASSVKFSSIILMAFSKSFIYFTTFFKTQLKLILFIVSSILNEPQHVQHFFFQTEENPEHCKNLPMWFVLINNKHKLTTSKNYWSLIGVVEEPAHIRYWI